MLNSTTRYGWGSADQKCSVAYCFDKISGQLNRFGCKSVLDVGCGNGAMTAKLAAAGFQVMGIEPDLDGLNIAKSAHPEIRFVHASVYEEPPQLEKFDAVVSSEVIEHLYSPSKLLEFSRELLRPNGILVLTTPYHGYLKNLAISLTNKWDGHFMALRDGGHIKFWSRDTISQLLRTSGFEVVSIEGAGRPWPFWASMVVTARVGG